MTCEWCGSSQHVSMDCPTRNLVRYLTGEQVSPKAPMPDRVVVASERDLVDVVREVHANQHLKSRRLKP